MVKLVEVLVLCLGRFDVWLWICESGYRFVTCFCVVFWLERFRLVMICGGVGSNGGFSVRVCTVPPRFPKQRLIKNI